MGLVSPVYDYIKQVTQMSMRESLEILSKLPSKQGHLHD